MIKDQITLKIVNQSNAPVPIKLFADPSSIYASTIKNVLVSWDLTTEPFSGAKEFTFTYGSNVFTSPSAPTSVSDVVSFLQTLDIATFYQVGKLIYATDLTDTAISTAIINIP